jgi:hypothetical protein
MAKSSVHVVPRDGELGVRRSGADRDSSRHDTQADAIRSGRGTAQREHTELFIHGRDGRIRDRDSFGNDPFPPRDMKR